MYNIKSTIRNGVPGRDCWLKFKDRHNLPLKKLQLDEYVRKKVCDPFISFRYFYMLKKK